MENRKKFESFGFFCFVVYIEEDEVVREIEIS